MIKSILILLVVVVGCLLATPVKKNEDEKNCMWDAKCSDCVKSCYYLVLKDKHSICIKSTNHLNGHIKIIIPPESFTACSVVANHSSQSSSSSAPECANQLTLSPSEQPPRPPSSSSTTTTAIQCWGLNYGHLLGLVALAALLCPVGCCFGGFIMFHLVQFLQTKKWEFSCINPFRILYWFKKKPNRYVPNDGRGEERGRNDMAFYKPNGMVNRPPRPPPPNHSSLIDFSSPSIPSTHMSTYHHHQQQQQPSSSSSILAEIHFGEFQRTEEEIMNEHEHFEDAISQLPQQNPHPSSSTSTTTNPFRNLPPTQQSNNNNNAKKEIRKSKRLAEKAAIKKEDLEKEP